MEQPISHFKTRRGLARIVGAIVNTRDGLVAAWRAEQAFRQEIVVLVIGTAIALILNISPFQKFVLIGVLVLVLIVELINSALEAVVDRISLERHPLSKNAKDYGCAAVALAITLAAAAWAVVLYNRFM